MTPWTSSGPEPSGAEHPAAEHPAGERPAVDRLAVVDTGPLLEHAIRRLGQGIGPVAVDAERASGFRYSDRAYLVQFYRRGAGTFLIDPIPFGSLGDLGDVIGDEEWVFHAATQDLPCLREIDLDPERIFDTELGARLLGMERVGLGAVVEELLGVHLAKAHSAADWSKRPLPRDWLEYAALDVELLLDVRDIMAELLDEAGKARIAEEEFDSILTRELQQKREEPWRRLTGLSKLKTPRQLAVARELWHARDEYARQTDRAPGRIVPDRALAAAALAMPSSMGALQALREFTGRESRSQLPRWWAAIERGRATDELPSRRVSSGNGMPSHRTWSQRDPDADLRLKSVRAELAELAEVLHMPVENVLTPDTLRRVCWSPPADPTPESVGAILREYGARPWQVQATAAVIAAALRDAPALAATGSQEAETAERAAGSPTSSAE
ncbi:3'-5' exonuclease [Pseudoclavibacter endophyticus]|nr:3'-5' exonuclease [Pseudoclavibacter endophyticus]